jgi:hypothetical protein
MTTRELAIARSVVYASLFDYPLTLEQLHHTLIESEQTPAEILAVYDGSALLQSIIEYRDGFFFPAGRGDVVAERRRREARSRVLLQDHARVLRLVCALPFTRLVALSGGIASLNPAAEQDLDLFIVTKGRRVSMVTVAVLVLAKLLHRRSRVRANVVLADTHLAIEQQDLITANQIVHLKPLIGEELLDAVVAANPFVTRCYPNSVARRHRPAGAPLVGRRERGVLRIKALAELILYAPSPLIEAACRRLHAWQLRRRAGSWRPPDHARLRDRFDAAVQQALERAENVPGPWARAKARR